jgi:hypothetical protein
MRKKTLVEKTVARLESGFFEISGVAAGSGFTLQPSATRANVVAMTQTHGLCHLRELADGIVTLSEQEPDLFAQLVASQEVVDLNCGGGLSGLLVAMLAATEGQAPHIFFIDHAKSAVDFAVDLAARLGIEAAGLVVSKQFLNAPTGELPDHNGLLVSAKLVPAMPQLSGATTIVAGHALSCHVFELGNRQDNLDLQNKTVLAQIDEVTDRRAGLLLVDVDIAFFGRDMDDFVTMLRASANSSSHRPVGKYFGARPENRTPGKKGKFKYFAAQQLDAIPSSENLVVWAVGDGDLLLTESEVEALIGERARHCRYQGLQELLAQGVK